MFQNVRAIQLPTQLTGMRIAPADDDEIKRIVRESGISADEGVVFYSVAGPNFRGYVAAGVMVTSEDSGEYFEPSEVWRDGPGSLG
ncbi:hypothetical protein [Leifsonia sp. NPDC058230]|uniref:hypothetical protein n=1 Tax=Leifsonia sp. NPDC058230 TaxID=3346391 RepID=UPI0036DA594D